MVLIQRLIQSYVATHVLIQSTHGTTHISTYVHALAWLSNAGTLNTVGIYARAYVGCEYVGDLTQGMGGEIASPSRVDLRYMRVHSVWPGTDENSRCGMSTATRNHCARSCLGTRIHTGTRSRSHTHPKHVHTCARDSAFTRQRDREATPSGNPCFRQLAQLSVSAIGPAHRRSIPASKGARSSG